MPFSQPQGLAVDSKNHLYIADAGNNRIVEYDDEFNYLRSIGDSSGQGRLSRPQGVFVHEDGRIFVADTGTAGWLYSALPVSSCRRTADQIPRSLAWITGLPRYRW